MSTIKSSNEHLTLNADGSSKDIKFQANGVEKASISSAGAFTSTTIDATKLTGALPAISGANLTGIASSPFTEVNANNFTYTTATNPALDVIDSTNTVKARFQAGNTSAVFGSASDHSVAFIQGASENTRMTITTDGHITMPSQPSAFVNGGGNTYIQVNDGSPAPFSNIVNQTGGSNYNTSNYRYTAPVAGWYQVSFGILSNGDISQEWMVNKNGTHIFRCYGKDRSWYQTGFYYCSASDYLEVVSGGSNSGNLYANTGASTYSWASYRLLG
jgi:hypothetical protein